LVFFGGIAALLGARQKKMEQNQRQFGSGWDPAND